MGLKNVFIEPWQIGKSTYAASTASVTVDATGAGDVLVIIPSTQKAIAIHRIEVSGTATAAAVINCSVVTRSSLDTGGVNSILTSTPLNMASTASPTGVLVYTTNPTSGTLVGTVASKKLLVSTVATQPEICVFDFNMLVGFSPVISPATPTNCIAVSFGGAAMAGNSFAFTVTWSDF